MVLRKIIDFVGNGPAKLSELRKIVFEKCVYFGDTAQVIAKLV